MNLSNDIHLFDVDYTLIHKSSSYYFLLEALRERVLSLGDLGPLPFEWLRYKLGIVHNDFIETAVKRLAGIDQSVVEYLAAACFQRALRANIFAEGFALVQDIKARGGRVHFATSSFHTLIRPLEAYFGVSGSLASSLEFVDGKTSGRVLGPALFGHNKKQVVRNWLAEEGLSPARVWFYSDSYTDLPLLEFCGHPVVVNPDRFLKREAERRGWEIRRWRKKDDTNTGQRFRIPNS